MPENMQRFVDLLLEFWNTGNSELASQLYGDDSERSDPSAEEPAQGVQQIAKYVTEIRAGFPDFKLQVDNKIYDGDQFAHSWSCTGTHKGEYKGIPPTGKHVRLTGVTTGRLRQGRVLEERVFYDRLSLLQQLGVIPAQASAATQSAAR